MPVLQFLTMFFENLLRNYLNCVIISSRRPQLFVLGFYEGRIKFENILLFIINARP